jgi:hypothetical protein
MNTKLVSWSAIPMQVALIRVQQQQSLINFYSLTRSIIGSEICSLLPHLPCGSSTRSLIDGCARVVHQLISYLATDSR